MRTYTSIQQMEEQAIVNCTARQLETIKSILARRMAALKDIPDAISNISVPSYDIGRAACAWQLLNSDKVNVNQGITITESCAGFNSYAFVKVAYEKLVPSIYVVHLYMNEVSNVYTAENIANQIVRLNDEMMEREITMRQKIERISPERVPEQIINDNGE